MCCAAAATLRWPASSTPASPPLVRRLLPPAPAIGPGPALALHHLVQLGAVLWSPCGPAHTPSTSVPLPIATLGKAASCRLDMNCCCSRVLHWEMRAALLSAVTLKDLVSSPRPAPLKDLTRSSPAGRGAGIRIPNHGFAREVCRGAGGALALTSANPSGALAALEAADFHPLWPSCSAVFDGAPCCFSRTNPPSPPPGCTRARGTCGVGWATK